MGRWVGADLQVGVNERKIAMYVKKELKQITFCKVGSFNVIVQFRKLWDGAEGILQNRSRGERLAIQKKNIQGLRWGLAKKKKSPTQE